MMNGKFLLKDLFFLLKIDKIHLFSLFTFKESLRKKDKI
jgi:hypothetical protein